MLMRDETVERALPITQHSYCDIYSWPWGGYTDRVIERCTKTQGHRHTYRNRHRHTNRQDTHTHTLKLTNTRTDSNT